MLRRLLIAVVTTGVVAVTVPTAVAQQSVARLYVVKPMPGHGGAFMEALAEHAQWRRQHDDPWSWAVSQVVAGDDLGAWYIRSEGHQWADLDAYDTSEFGMQAFEHWIATVGPHIEHAAGYVTTNDTTTARWPEDQSAIRFVHLVDFHLKPDMVETFFELVGKYHEAIVEHDYPSYYAFNWMVAGGTGPMVRLALPYESWAGMAQPEQSMEAVIAETYGEEEAKAMSNRFNESLVGTRSTVLALRPDLSVGMGM